ncbi:hypothetical protein QE152_g26611 [Popillia japonica]|uniref:Retrovirus-related Pol polyprotein from transposon TNT 1-94-like beta-barrel domain-containing protein n=1 Tax=Popillia japonica TaxID=7064 RepID=A0AAW1JYU5_POPJA
MTSRRNLFSEFFEDSEFGFVKVADNKVLPTAGIGTVEIQVVLNGKVFDGASMHMTSRRNLFSEFFEDSEFGFVKVADNKVLPTAGIGTVEIQVVLNGKVFDRRLSKVLSIKYCQQLVLELWKSKWC